MLHLCIFEAQQHQFLFDLNAWKEQHEHSAYFFVPQKNNSHMVLNDLFFIQICTFGWILSLGCQISDLIWTLCSYSAQEPADTQTGSAREQHSGTLSGNSRVDLEAVDISECFSDAECRRRWHRPKEKEAVLSGAKGGGIFLFLTWARVTSAGMLWEALRRPEAISQDEKGEVRELTLLSLVCCSDCAPLQGPTEVEGENNRSNTSTKASGGTKIQCFKHTNHILQHSQRLDFSTG